MWDILIRGGVVVDNATHTGATPGVVLRPRAGRQRGLAMPPRVGKPAGQAKAASSIKTPRRAPR
jgi:hypothetical protein